jgi:hypothetical protein
LETLRADAKVQELPQLSTRARDVCLERGITQAADLLRMRNSEQGFRDLHGCSKKTLSELERVCDILQDEIGATAQFGPTGDALAAVSVHERRHFVGLSPYS